jgi:hypothetical protein
VVAHLLSGKIPTQGDSRESKLRERVQRSRRLIRALSVVRDSSRTLTLRRRLDLSQRTKLAESCRRAALLPRAQGRGSAHHDLR